MYRIWDRVRTGDSMTNKQVNLIRFPHFEGKVHTIHHTHINWHFGGPIKFISIGNNNADGKSNNKLTEIKFFTKQIKFMAWKCCAPIFVSFFVFFLDFSTFFLCFLFFSLFPTFFRLLWWCVAFMSTVYCRYDKFCATFYVTKWKIYK